MLVSKENRMKTEAGRLDDKYFLEGLKRSDTKVFEALFDLYYANLVMFCGNYLKDIHKCEDIVSGVFVTLWERREKITISKSLKAYLLNAVKNRALNEVRHDKIRYEHARNVCLYDALEIYDVDDYVLYTDMRRILDKAVDALPEKIIESYVMYRDGGMKSSEIAKKMNVTQRTIELRVCKALSILRRCLECIILLLVV